MSFIGNVPAEAYSPVAKDTFSGDGSTTDFTPLSIPATTNSVEVFVENVQQEPTTAYTISGTTLSFTAAPVTGTNNIYVIHRGPAVQQIVPPAGVALNPSTVDATGDISTEGDLKVEVTSGGIYTITGTDTATNRTLTLPDEAGTIVTTAGIPAANITGSLPKGVGGMKLLSSQTASNDTYVIFDNTIITSDYKNYRLIAHAVTPATDQVNTRIWMSVDNGSNFNVSTIGGRQYTQLGGADNGHENTSGGGGETDISTTVGSDTDENIDYIIDFIGVGVSGSYTKLSYQCIGENQNGLHYNWKGASVFLSTSAVNYIRCGFASGNVESGQFFLYGVES